MAAVAVSVSSDMDPLQAWTLASDLPRFDEWMTILGGWKSPIPDVIERGAAVSSLITVKGFRNVIHWEVTEFQFLRLIEMSGTCRGGVHIKLTMRIRNNKPGSTFHLTAKLSGGLLNGRVGDLVAKVLESDVRRSVENLAAMKLEGATAPQI